eukprot:6129268-Amphidinium_carterae.1
MCGGCALPVGMSLRAACVKVASALGFISNRDAGDRAISSQIQSSQHRNLVVLIPSLVPYLPAWLEGVSPAIGS